MNMLNKMSEAPKDGTPVILRTNDKAAPGFKNITFVGRNRGDLMEWGFAAPVGCGGFPDEWFDGWMPLTVFEAQ